MYIIIQVYNESTQHNVIDFIHVQSRRSRDFGVYNHIVMKVT